MRGNLSRRLTQSSVKRKLASAADTTLRTRSRARWLSLPIGASSLFLVSPAFAQTFRPGGSSVNIIPSPGIGPTAPAESSIFVSGTTLQAEGATPSSSELNNTYTIGNGNPALNLSSLIFPTGFSSNIVAAVGALPGNGNLGVTLGVGTGVSQVNPNGQYPYASQIDINIPDVKYLVNSPFPATNNYPGISYQFPIGAYLPPGGSVSFDASLTFTLTNPNSGARSIGTFNYISPVMTNSAISGPSIFVSNSNSFSGNFALNSGVPFNANSAQDFIDISGNIIIQSIIDSPPTSNPTFASSIGPTAFCVPTSPYNFESFITQPASASAGAGPGSTFENVNAVQNPNLGVATSWVNITGGTRTGPPGATDLALFDAGSALNSATQLNLSAPATWDGISIINPGATVNITGTNTLTLGSYGITFAADTNGLSQNLVLASGVNLAASQTWNIISGQSVTVNGALGTGTSALTIAGAGNATINAGIGGFGSIIMSSTGTLLLTNDNSYGGGTTLNTGEVQISSDHNIGGISSAIAFNGGILGVLGTSLTNLNTHAVNWASFNGGFDIVSGANTFTISQNIGNAATNGGSVTKLGGGILVLSGSNTYTGPTIIDGGTLVLSGASSLNPASQIIINSTRGLQLANNVNLPNPITVNVASGEFLSIGAASPFLGAISGNITTAPGAEYTLGIPDVSGGLTLTGASTVSGLNQPAAISDGSMTFAGNGSLTTNLNTPNSLTLGSPTTLSVNLIGNSTITNLGTGGASIGNNQAEQVVQINLNNQSAFNLGLGAFNLDTSTAASVNNNIALSGGILTTSGFIFAPPAGSASGAFASITFNGGVITASANNANFFPNPTAGQFSLIEVGGGAIINTNGFNIAVNTAGGFSNNGGNGGLTKNGPGQLVFGPQFASNGTTYQGPTTVNGGLLEFTSSAQIGGAIQMTLGAAVGVDDGATHDSGFLALLTSGGVSPSGGLALAPADANVNIDFTGTVSGAFNMANVDNASLTNMSLGATSAGVTYTATITPFVPSPGTVLYPLGGGGSLTLGQVTTGANSRAAGGTGVPLVDYQGTPSRVFAENGGAVILTTTNTYTGSTSIEGSFVQTLPATVLSSGVAQTELEPTTLAVMHLADGASSLGNSSNAASNLIINGGILQYIGTGDTSSRLFTIGQFGATLDSSGAGPINFSNTGTELVIVRGAAVVPLTLTGTNTGSNNLSGILKDPGTGQLALIKNASGAWTSSGLNTYSGGTTVNAGTLNLAGQSPLGNISGSLAVNTGATLNLNNTSPTVGALSGAGTIDNLGGAGAITFSVGSGNATSEFDGIIKNSTGAVTLAKLGTGTITLTGNNAYSGPTDLNAGELSISSDANIGGPAAPINFNGGALQVTGTALTNLNTHSVNGAATGPSATWQVLNLNLDIANAAAVFTVSQNITNVPGGLASLTKLGPGTLVLSGSNSYSGGTDIVAGTLIVPNLADLGTGSLIDNGTLMFNSGTSSLANISGSGGLTAAGSNLTLFTSNTYAGLTTVMSGSTLTVNAINAIPSGGAVANDGSVAINAATTVGAVTGAGTFTVASGVTFFANNFVQNALVNNGNTTIACGGEVYSITGSGNLTLGTSAMTSRLILYPSGSLNQQNSLTITPGSTLDITTQAFAINYGTAANEAGAVTAVRNELISGYNKDTWTGTGIDSSSAAANPGLYAVGYADGNSDPASGAAPNQILMTETLAGDANLDHIVNFPDLLVVAQNYGKSGMDWAHGDFNYDNFVNFPDLLLVAQNYGKQLSTSQLSQLPTSFESEWQLAEIELAASGIQTSNPVPEPPEISLVIFAAGCILTRRRKRARYVYV